MSVSKSEQLADVIDNFRSFRLCGPSDDPDKQAAVALGYRYLLVQLKSLATPLLQKAEATRLNAIEVDVHDIYSVYNASAEVDALLPDIEVALEQSDGSAFSVGTNTDLAENPLWRKGMFRLFVSHLADNKTVAANFQKALFRYGISSFVAHNDIEPTQEWQTQIETALATSDALIALLHEKFHTSKWTDQEIGFAMGRGVPVFAVRYGQDPYGFIERFQAFNGNGKNTTELARELFDAFCKNERTQRRISECIVDLFEDSSSFIEAKERIGYLEKLELWEPSFSERIRSARKDNSQIKGSFGVPARVESLLKKWESSKI